MDYHNIWSAGSHGAVVLPVDGPTTLIVDNAYWRPDLVVANDVRAGARVVEMTIDAMRDSNLIGKKVGLVGTGAMTAAAYMRLADEVGSTSLVVEDGILDDSRLNWESSRNPDLTLSPVRNLSRIRSSSMLK